MFSTVVGQVWLVFFKDRIEAVCNDESSCMRFFREWCNERGLQQGEMWKSFKFIKRDIVKITQRKPRKK